MDLKGHKAKLNMEASVTDDSDSDFRNSTDDETDSMEESIVSDSEVELPLSENDDRTTDVCHNMRRSRSLGSGRSKAVACGYGGHTSAMRACPRHIADCQDGILCAIKLLEEALELGLSMGRNDCGGVCACRQAARSTHDYQSAASQTDRHSDYLHSSPFSDSLAIGSDSDVPLLRSRFRHYGKR
ncbi:hypothetical protein BKA56DRAFT_622087 [Ilyonectria sp. MPI-CAGE-AT-0026]|nr:hypothetical protein BKA56DRAFT_622087 [Ilyonectria sp. MPI-CAGE-AT-0026]